MPAQNQTGDLKQTRTVDTSRSPDLMVWCLLIGSYLIYPNLAQFTIPVLAHENQTGAL